MEFLDTQVLRALSHHSLSLAAFITNITVSTSFSVHTGAGHRSITPVIPKAPNSFWFLSKCSASHVLMQQHN